MILSFVCLAGLAGYNNMRLFKTNGVVLQDSPAQLGISLQNFPVPAARWDQVAGV
jgi:hypothetical protein